jgi:hypothetical protein
MAQWLHPIDDHTGDNITIPDSRDKAFIDASRKAWASTRARRQPVEDLQKSLLEPNDTLVLYRYVNRPAISRLMIETDMGATLGDGTPPHVPHVRHPLGNPQPAHGGQHHGQLPRTSR